MRFELGQRVKIKATGAMGEIVQTKHEKILTYKKEVTESTSYYIRTVKLPYGKWYSESEIENEYEFNDDFEIELRKLLIDVSLKTNNIDAAKQFHKERMELLHSKQEEKKT